MVARKGRGQKELFGHSGDVLVRSGTDRWSVRCSSILLFIDFVV